MSDKIFPNERNNEYRFEDEEEAERSRIRDLLKNISQRIKDVRKELKRYLSRENKQREENRLDGSQDSIGHRSSHDYSSTEETSFNLGKSRGKNSLADELGPKSYLVYGVELVLVTYFTLALLGLVPMF